MAHPEWVRKQRQKGTEIRCIGGHYYLYRVTSKWNKEKGRAQKITLGIVGKITEEGIKPSKKRKEKDPHRQTDQAPRGNTSYSPEAGQIPPKAAPAPKLSAVEHGATSILREIGQPIEAGLKELFGEDGIALYICAQLRLVETCALKQIKPLYEQSSLAHCYSDIQVGANQLSALFQRIGRQRASIVAFFKNSSPQRRIFCWTGRRYYLNRANWV